MDTSPAAAWIERRHEQGARILTLLTSRLDPKAYPRAEFAQTVSEAIADGEERIVLNLSKLKYTNHSWGILQLAFTAAQLVHGTPCRLAVCGLKGHPRRTYLFADADRFIPEFRTERDAIEAFNKPVAAS